MTVDRYTGFTFDPAELAEDVDLDLERRKEILYADAHLARATHWEALGVPWNAPADAARAAFLDRAMRFHPDRHAGRRLGRYRPRLDRIFRRLTEARDVLCDEDRRAAYARATAPPEELARLELRRVADERRAEERRARLARQNPVVARASRIAGLVRRGREALDEGRVGPAANDLLLAQGLDPANAEIAALAAEARRRAGGQRSAELFERALAKEATGSLAAALALHREVLELDPRHVRAAVHAARCALAAGDVAAARAHAEHAVRAEPGAAVAHEALGLALEAAGARKDARRALERALSLDPELKVARERLRRLRWSFLG